MDTARWALNDNGPSISENQTCVMTGRDQLAIEYSNIKSLSSLNFGGTLFVGKGGVAESRSGKHLEAYRVNCASLSQPSGFPTRGPLPGS